jgi:hypothetical protein
MAALATFLTVISCMSFPATADDGSVVSAAPSGQVVPPVRPALSGDRIGRDLEELVQEYVDYEAAHGGVGHGFAPTRKHLAAAGGYVFLESIASGDPELLASDLRALGMTYVRVLGNRVSGHLPIKALPAAGALQSLRFARSTKPEFHAGLFTSQGDGAMRSDIARTVYGVDGTGVAVGIISDSFDCLKLVPSTSPVGAAVDIATGDLPPASQINIIQD